MHIHSAFGKWAETVIQKGKGVCLKLSKKAVNFSSFFIFSSSFQESEELAFMVAGAQRMAICKSYNGNKTYFSSSLIVSCNLEL